MVDAQKIKVKESKHIKKDRNLSKQRRQENRNYKTARKQINSQKAHKKMLNITNH